VAAGVTVKRTTPLSLVIALETDCQLLSLEFCSFNVTCWLGNGRG